MNVRELAITLTRAVQDYPQQERVLSITANDFENEVTIRVKYPPDIRGWEGVGERVLVLTDEDRKKAQHGDRITNAMNEVIDGVGLPHLEKKLRELKKEIKSEGDTK